jgi:hypothetical protein
MTFKQLSVSLTTLLNYERFANRQHVTFLHNSCYLKYKQRQALFPTAAAVCLQTTKSCLHGNWKQDSYHFLC